MLVKELSAFEFLLFYADKFPKIISYYCKGMYCGAEVFLLVDDDCEVGVAVFSPEGDDVYYLNYIYIYDNKRNIGNGKRLLFKACEIINKKGIGIIYSRAVINNEYIVDVFKSCGFLMTDESIVVRSSIMSDNEEIWNKYIARKTVYTEKWSKMNNISVCSFSDAPENVMKTIFDMKNNDFPKELNSFDILCGRCGRLENNMSFVAYTDEKPVSYTMISAVDKNSLVFSHISTCNEYKGKGAFIIPLIHSMNEMFKSRYTVVCYAILKNNLEMNSVFDSMLSIFKCTSKRQIYLKKQI